MDKHLRNRNTRPWTTMNIEEALVCLVSGENDSVGTIINANISMRKFVGISEEKMKMRT